MAKIAIVAVTIVLAVGVLSEPPVGRQYLPPAVGIARALTNSRYNMPSARYGAPSPLGRSSATAFGRGYNSPHSYNSRLNIPSSISTQYGVPSGVPAAASAFNAFNAPIPAGPLAGPAFLSAQYGAPAASSRFGGVNGLSAQYGAPAAGSSGLANTYGAPADFSRNSGLPAAQYGAPLAGYSAQEDPLAEPANYQFSYAVQDEESGSEFGQEETRQLETAQGSYRVLLPDGRLQVVEYQADEEGYKPEVRYEETAVSRGAGGPYPASRALQGPY
ncbi:pro-resilin-like [Bacillus rossius redtenbacheri]|uniref:pro-resilin-like n=1 Tax=Bacillus rossius redtenbacheri TaxID=93214 RepID=UPI002FDD16BD